MAAPPVLSSDWPRGCAQWITDTPQRVPTEPLRGDKAPRTAQAQRREKEIWVLTDEGDLSPGRAAWMFLLLPHRAVLGNHQQSLSCHCASGIQRAHMGRASPLPPSAPPTSGLFPASPLRFRPNQKCRGPGELNIRAAGDPSRSSTLSDADYAFCCVSFPHNFLQVSCSLYCSYSHGCFCVAGLGVL